MCRHLDEDIDDFFGSGNFNPECHIIWPLCLWETIDEMPKFNLKWNGDEKSDKED